MSVYCLLHGFRAKKLPVGAIYTDIVLDSSGLPYSNALADKCGEKYLWDLFGRRYTCGKRPGEKKYEPMFSNQGQLLHIDNCGNKRISGIILHM